MTVDKVIELQEQTKALRKHKDRENALTNLLDKFEQGENLRLVVKKGADEYALEANKSDMEADALRVFLATVRSIEQLRITPVLREVRHIAETMELNG